MDKSFPKIVDNNHYHLWTDALHARALAHQATNKWDCASYVRWTLTTAWTVLEIACQDALEEPEISYSFKKKLNCAIEQKSLPPLNWGEGIWQAVLNVQELRKNCVHRFISEVDLFPEAILADQVISVVRDAIKTIYIHSEKSFPAWVEDDNDRGWSKKGSISCHAMVIRSGVDQSNLNNIRITYVHDGEEKVSEMLSPETDPSSYIEDLINGTNVPITMIRVYRGDQLISERPLLMRGSE